MEKLNGEARSRSFPALASAPRRDFLARGAAFATGFLIPSIRARAAEATAAEEIESLERLKAKRYRKARLREYEENREKIDMGEVPVDFDQSVKLHIFFVAWSLGIPVVIASRLWFHESHAGKLRQSETGAKGSLQLTSAVFDDMLMVGTDNHGFPRYKKYFEKLPMRALSRLPHGAVRSSLEMLRDKKTQPAEYRKALQSLRTNVLDPYANSAVGLVYFASLYDSAGEVSDSRICVRASETVAEIKDYEISLINRARSVFAAPGIRKSDLSEGLKLEMKYFPESARMLTALVNYNGEPTRKHWYAATIFA